MLTMEQENEAVETAKRMAVSVSRTMNFNDSPELVSHALFLTGKYLPKYDETRATVKTYVTQILKTRLPQFILRQRDVASGSGHEEVGVLVVETPERQRPSFQMEWKENLRQLSPEAQKLISSIVSGEVDLDGTQNGKELKSRTRRFARDTMGVSKHQYYLIKKEIQHFLEETVS